MPRILGVDYGERRTGLALGDRGSAVAVGRGTVEHKSLREATEKIGVIVATEKCDLIVIGLPLTLAGKKGERAKRSESFGQRLQQLTKKEVIFMDERFSSKLAEQLIGLGNRDERAAILILQNYLDKQS